MDRDRQGRLHRRGRPFSAERHSRPMPVAGKLSAARASDYSVVSVFEGEAFLATADDLVRVVVGVRRPGLGTVTSVTSLDDGGGTVVGTEASLRTE